MKLSCSSCQHQFQIDDAKVPAGTFKLKCPKCGKVITASRESGAAAPAEPVHESASAAPSLEQENDSENPAVRAFVKKEMASMKKELMGAMASLLGGSAAKWQHAGESGQAEEEDDDDPLSKKALICEDDQAYIDIITQAVKHLGYSIDIARSTAEAIKKVESQFYQLVTVDYIFPDDKEGGNKILSKINGQKPGQRRQQFVVLISSSVKSADSSAAFFHGANITVNKEEIRNLEALIRAGQRNFHEIYAMFSRVLTEKAQRM